ncbi:hypothetical protein [Fodinibius halophilus]|uniref:Uncharacterized protein n=1 Tax=Fodinibius halophilus TaxID=1736908 RepID=A0A6M1T9W3_9BACT|nr:hypothetical protein [Fodinibius halophilus]NGP87152.1 hypothetical protein [Fodinibius halophilus]
MNNSANIFKTSIFLFFLLLLSINPSNTNALDVDCDAMVEECSDRNPYWYILQPGEWAAYEMGCGNAGDICKAMKE